MLLGITGKDFTIVAASKAAMRGPTILKATDDKTRELNRNTLMAFSGEAGDTVQFAEFIQANVKLYSMRNNTDLGPAAVANFVRGELGLPCVEFDRTSAEGGTSAERLSGLLDEAAIAFSIVTADDERAGEEFHAWTSTIYEAGFAQGRLGLTRAFVLLDAMTIVRASVLPAPNVPMPTSHAFTSSIV